ncbi:OsmC-like protein [Beggiatoa sp. PS]|nr:OsmC-like protein [Beggiatoa sp. PS]
MEINVSYGDGMKVNAEFKHFTIHTDQSKKVGGEETAPEPFAYFLSSLATCAGFFVLRFCQTRKISTEGIRLRQSNDWDNGRVENIHLEIELPPSFPEKYTQALIRATNECSVKKALMNPPSIDVTTKIVDTK